MNENCDNTNSLKFMAHEIKNPLNGLMGNLQILKYTKLNQEQTQYIDNIEFCCNQISGIINQILDLNKIKNKQLKLNKKMFNLHNCVKSIYKMFYSKLKKNPKIKFQLMVESDSPKYIYNDEKRIKQIVINFISNAIKFTEKGSIILSIKTVNTPSSNTHRKITEKPNLLDISVKDTGIGIEKENLNKIFEPYYSTKNSSGLGLTISSKLAKMMNGKIEVKSENHYKNKGTKFSLLIPIHQLRCLEKIN